MKRFKRCSNKTLTVSDIFSAKYTNGPISNQITVQTLIRKFEITGTVYNKGKCNKNFLQNARHSLRKIAAKYFASYITTIFFFSGSMATPYRKNGDGFAAINHFRIITFKVFWSIFVIDIKVTITAST